MATVLKFQNLLGKQTNVFDDVFNSIVKYDPTFIKTVADCGAGVGDTTLLYESILSRHSDGFHIVSYEPMPVNYKILVERTQGKKNITTKNMAVYKNTGSSLFSVPYTVKDNESFHFWLPGTSYAGFIKEKPNKEHECYFDVPTIKLKDESIIFDFIKLDLQGGEHDALLGLEDNISQSKLLYIEHRLDVDAEKNTIDLLNNYNFSYFFDSMQAGFDHKKNIKSHDLKELGLEIIYISYNPYYFKIKINEAFLDPARNYLPRLDYIHLLKQKYGMIYAQTDIIAIHNEYKDILKYCQIV